MSNTIDIAYQAGLQFVGSDLWGRIGNNNKLSEQDLIKISHAIDIFSPCLADIKHLASRYRIGLLYGALGSYNRAIECLQQGVRLCESSNIQYAIRRHLVNISITACNRINFHGNLDLIKYNLIRAATYCLEEDDGRVVAYFDALRLPEEMAEELSRALSNKYLKMSYIYYVAGSVNQAMKAFEKVAPSNVDSFLYYKMKAFLLPGARKEIFALLGSLWSGEFSGQQRMFLDSLGHG